MVFFFFTCAAVNDAATL
jgi:hypothetical protein